jgi:hypothetical protein
VIGVNIRHKDAWPVIGNQAVQPFNRLDDHVFSRAPTSGMPKNYHRMVPKSPLALNGPEILHKSTISAQIKHIPENLSKENV